MDDCTPGDGGVGAEASGSTAELLARATEVESRVPTASVGPRTDGERATAGRAKRPAVPPWSPEAGVPAGQEGVAASAASGSPHTAPTPTASFQVALQDFHFPALHNGLDFLRSTVELLARQGVPEPRDLKYAVLHLRTAAEVLFKARLEMHDPKLVWWEPSKFDKAKHKVGDFKSCGAEKAIERLNEQAENDGVFVLNMALDPEDADLVALRELRNRLTHFGCSDTADAVQARTLPVLVLLLKFLRLDVLPYIRDRAEAWTVEQEMDCINAQLHHIEDYVAHRKTEIADDLCGHEYVTVACRTCGQDAVVLDGGAVDLKCHFCGKGYGTGVEAAWEYIGESRHITISEGGEDFDSCSVCGDSAVAYLPTAAEPDTASHICFSCGSDHAGVCDYCQQAGDLAFTIKDMGEDMCEDCYAYRLAKF
ncbi:hypothetical protein [Streptomyces sp. DEF1AK]|uniref:hypothetical protein n=1 Tax=Streptomyces sp. DEF1AK TaxID=2759677 RepID=UPI00191570DC|nr:hypothetical protein [Streptomyces sp. DEF1AK]MBK3390415.1 hypothetical protein [Streptomyces sp. DEF1AK]